MSDQFGLILDGLFMVLLVASIVYSSMLSRRLGKLRDSRAEMLQATRDFADAASRADAGIRGWKKMVEESHAALAPTLEQARKMKEELTFLVEAGEALANRLAEGPRGGGHEPRPAVAERPAAEPAASAGASVTPLKTQARRRPGPLAAREEQPARRGADLEILRALENLR